MPAQNCMYPIKAKQATGEFCKVLFQYVNLERHFNTRTVVQSNMKSQYEDIKYNNKDNVFAHALHSSTA